MRASSSPRERSPPAPSSSAREDARVRLRRRRFARASRGDAHRERRVAERVTVRPRPEELLSRQGRALVVHRDDLRALALHGTHPGGEVLHRRRHLEESDERVLSARAEKAKSPASLETRETASPGRTLCTRRFGRSRPKSAMEILVTPKARPKSRCRFSVTPVNCFQTETQWRNRILSSCKIRPERPSTSPAWRVEARPGCVRHNRRRPCCARKFVTRTHRATRRSELLTFAHTPTSCPPSPPT